MEDLAGGLLRTVLMVTFLWSPLVGSSVGLTFLLAVDELVLEPNGAGGTVETYLITALLEPKPNWLAVVVVAVKG